MICDNFVFNDSDNLKKDERLTAMFYEAKSKIDLEFASLVPNQQKVIVYVTTREQSNELTQSINNDCRRNERIAVNFHAGLLEEEKQSNLMQWRQNASTVYIIATTALGMGVHLPCVRVVVHLTLARTMHF